MASATTGDGRRLFYPALGGFYARMEPIAYALLRAGFGLTMVTHGVPKLLGIPHGSMRDSFGGSARMIENELGLPFAIQLAQFVTALEVCGGLAVAIGLLTRLFAPMFALQMAAICIALAPTYPWGDRGFEYPLLLGLIAFAISIRGGGAYSLDRRLGREL